MSEAPPPSLSLMVSSTGPLRQEKAGFFPSSEVYKTMLPFIPVSDFVSKVKTTVPRECLTLGRWKKWKFGGVHCRYPAPLLIWEAHVRIQPYWRPWYVLPGSWWATYAANENLLRVLCFGSLKALMMLVCKVNVVLWSAVCLSSSAVRNNLILSSICRATTSLSATLLLKCQVCV